MADINKTSHLGWLAAACLLGLLLLTGCERAKPTSYQIPKEERSVQMPMPGAAAAAAPAATGSAGNGMRVLPGMQDAAEAAGEILYTVPTGWTELPASGLRKATLQVSDANGSAELTVLVFPGDVGGTLANINRWRGQIGLDPATEPELPSMSEAYSISQHRGLYVRLLSEPQSILGGLLPFHGNTWFFKFMGDSATVQANETQMKAFLDSIGLEDNAH